MVLFDIEKAFDSVWHHSLIFKLKQFGFPDYLCSLVLAFTTNRSFSVHIGNSQSSPRNIPAGLSQGSILSPTLYSLYVSLSDLKFDRHTLRLLCRRHSHLCLGKSHQNNLVGAAKITHHCRTFLFQMENQSKPSQNAGYNIRLR